MANKDGIVSIGFDYKKELAESREERYAGIN